MTWKQFWCRHIWKDIKSEFLKKFSRYDTYFEEVKEYRFYAITQECILCKKIRISEKEKMVV